MLRPASRPGMRSRCAASVCSTCLTATELASLQNTPQYLDICNGLSLSTSDMICYNCRVTLSGFYKFRAGALQAQKVLAVLRDQCRALHRSTKRPCTACLSTLPQNKQSPKTESQRRDNLQVEIEMCEVKEEMSEPKSDSEMSLPMPLVEATQEVLKMEDDEVEVAEVVCYTEEVEVKSDLESDDSSRTETASECEDEIANSKVHADNSAKHNKPALDKQRSTKAETDLEEEGVKEKYNFQQEEAFTVKRISQSEVQSHYARMRRSYRYRNARFKCASCAIVFTTEGVMKAHSKKHSETGGRFKCTICELRFKKKADLETHTAEHFCRFHCRLCPFVEYSYGKMKVHYNKRHNDRPRFCRHCPATFDTHKEYRSHIDKLHRAKLSCDRCSRKFVYKYELRHHVEVHHTKRPKVECNICHKKYRGQWNLENHMRSRHGEVKKAIDSDNTYCAECDKQFKDKYQYRVHLLHTAKHVTADQYRYECDYCHKKFIQKQSIRSHIELMHLRIAKYKCSACSETFPTTKYRNRHKRLKHGGQLNLRKHYCHICGKAFTIKKSLEQHLNAHFGLRPYVCKVCGATFSYSGALFTHNRLVHLKVKRGKGRDT